MLILVAALIGILLHARAHCAGLTLVLVLVVGFTIGVQIGVRHNHRLHVKHQRRTFTGVVLLPAALIVYK